MGKRGPKSQRKPPGSEPAKPYNKGGEVSPTIGDNGITATPEVMQNKTALFSELYYLTPIDINDEEEVRDRVAWYLNWCVANQLRPLIEGVAMSLGISVRAFRNWQVGEVSAKWKTDIAVKVKTLINLLLTDLAVNNKIHPTAWIFYGKNWFDMVDKIEHVTSGDNPLGQLQSIDDIKSRIVEAVDVEGIDAE